MEGNFTWITAIIPALSGGGFARNVIKPLDYWVIPRKKQWPWRSTSGKQKVSTVTNLLPDSFHSFLRAQWFPGRDVPWLSPCSREESIL